LPADGTYTVLLAPFGTNIGTGTFTLYSVPPDVTATIAANGSPVSLTTTAPGQNMVLTFSGTANQSISFLSQFSGLGGCSSFIITILEPDGATQLFNQNGCGNGPLYTGPLTLPSTGTYTILVDLQGMNVGTGTFNLYTIPPPVTATISANGTPVSLTTTVPSQNMTLTFSGTANQGVQLLAQFSGLGGCFSFAITILEPDGVTKLFNNGGCGNGPLFTGALTLPATGTYTISVILENTNVGTGTFTLYPVLPAATGTISQNGTSVSLTTTAPSQAMQLTFTGSVGERVTLQTQVSNSFTGCASYSIAMLQPNGTTTVYSNNNCGNNSDFSDVLVLPVAGTYTIVLTPFGLNIGTGTFILTDVPADASATITPGGGTVSLTTTTFGQNMSLTFSGTAGQRVSLFTEVSGTFNNCSSYTVVILQPNGSSQLYNNRECGTC
jgi:hypothetical protein